MGSPRKAAWVIIVVFALSFISSSYVAADRVLWHSSLESIHIKRDAYPEVFRVRVALWL